MSADDYVFIGFAWYVGGHVMNSLYSALDIDGFPDLDAGYHKRTRLEVFVDAGFEIHQVFACRFKPGSNQVFFHLDKRNPRIGWPIGTAKLFQRVLVCLVIGRDR